MLKKIQKMLYIGGILFVCLALLFIFGDSLVVIPKGALFETERIARSVIILFLAYVFIQLIVLTLIDRINKKRERKLSSVVKSSISILTYSIALVMIITGVYKQSIVSISAFLIGSWAVVAISFKDFLINCINGVLLDFNSDFEVGDWVMLKNGTIAKIKDMKMAGVELLMENDTILNITSTSFSSGEIINISKPRKDYRHSIKVTLPHNIPIDQARQLLYSATIASNAVHNEDVSVFAESMEINVVEYIVTFRVKSREKCAESRHQIIASVIKHFNKFGYRIYQITGDLSVPTVDKSSTYFKLNDVQQIVASPIEILKMSNLLKTKDYETISKLEKYMIMRTFQKEEKIIQEESMFIVAEGLVELEENKKQLIIGDYFQKSAVAKTDYVILYEIKNEVLKLFNDKFN